MSEVLDRAVREFVIDCYTHLEDGRYELKAGFATLVLDEAEARAVIRTLLKAAQRAKEATEGSSDS